LVINYKTDLGETPTNWNTKDKIKHYNETVLFIKQKQALSDKLSVRFCFSFRRELFSGAFDSAKNHKRQRRKRQSVTAKREKSQTPKFVKVRLGQVKLG